MVPDPSERLVKWINSGNLHCRAQKQEMRNQTRRAAAFWTKRMALLVLPTTTNQSKLIGPRNGNACKKWAVLNCVAWGAVSSSPIIGLHHNGNACQKGGSIELCSLGSPVQSDEGAVTHSSSADNTVFIFDCPDGALFNEKVAARSWTRAS
jgi:hypothetical protein